MPIQVSEDFLKQMMQTVTENPETEIAIDVENQKLSYNGVTTSFELDSYKKICLINGYDDIDYLISRKENIEAYEKNRALSF